MDGAELRSLSGSPPDNDNRMNSSTTSSMERSIEGETILATHDGTLLKEASAEFIGDLNTSGTLKLIEQSSNKIIIAWQPIDNILITDESSQDQDEWSLVDTIQKRQRTVSESRAFNTKFDSQALKPRRLEVPVTELKFVEVQARGQMIRLIKKSDSSLHSVYFFQHGNADIFVRELQQCNIVAPDPGSRNLFNILDPDARKLKKTFAALQLEDIKASGGWLTNLVWKNMEFLAKVSDYVTPVQPPTGRENRSEDYEILGHQEKSDQESANRDEQATRKEESRARIEPPATLSPRRTVTRGPPLNEKQWCEFQTEDGRISDPLRVKEIIFRGGIEESIRPIVWKYLLSYYIWEETTAETSERRRLKTAEYYQMKAQWLSMTDTQEKNFSGYRERKCQIEKDVIRTDRSIKFFAGEQNPNIDLLQDILMTYVMYNFDLGYVQGMGDLLAHILAVVQNEADSFWCFVGFMELVFSNFDMDQAGMKRQFRELHDLIQFCNPELFEYLSNNDSANMFFCFRWLLVWFNREFSGADIIELWEVLWTGLPCPNFHLFISAAILETHKQTIVDNKFQFDDILKYVNALSMQLVLNDTLETAEAIYLQIKDSERIPHKVRILIGEESSSSDMSESFDLVNRDEEEIRQRKLEEACENSMNLAFL